MEDGYSLVEVSELLALEIPRVRSLVRDHRLVASRTDEGVIVIPKLCFIQHDGRWRVLESLHGTMTLLLDCGFDADQAARWLFNEHEILGTKPILALRAGRTHEVRRIAGAEAL